MEINLTNKTIFIDFEGTLSESPKEEPTLGELLFGQPFTNLKPNAKVIKLLEKVNPKKIYVLGIIDTNNEIQQKYFWLEQHYPKIEDQNVIFVANNHQKVDVISEYQKKLNLKTSDIVFIDDKEKHLAPARLKGFECVDVNNL